MAEVLKVVGIFVAPQKGEPMVSLKTVEVVVGQGVVGDRYSRNEGFWSGKNGVSDPDRELSIISTQGIEAANFELMEQGLQPVSPEQMRRTFLVDCESADLKNLVGTEFGLGESVLVKGTRDCAPCGRIGFLAKRSADVKAIMQAFAGGRAGIRAKVITGGTVTVYTREQEI